LHDGTAEEGHGELHYSLEFAAQAKVAGFQFAFRQLPPTLHYHLEAWSNMLDWMLPQRLDDRPKAPPAKASSPPGPIANAFAEPFIVVEGTGGDVSDQAGMQSISQAFQSVWRKIQYGSCRVAKDRDLSDSDKAGYNLILLGNATTNSIWRDIESRVPAKIAPDGITIGAKKWTGTGLSVQAVFRNPFNPARLAVVIGAADLAAAHFGTMNLSVDGWFDFAVWRTQSEAAELVAADSYGIEKAPSASSGKAQLFPSTPGPSLAGAWGGRDSLCSPQFPFIPCLR
jgi:hypothetical protein